MVLLILSLACGREEPPDHLTTTTTLGGDLNSGMAIAAATQAGSLRRCEWSMREVDRLERPGEGTLWVLVEARADPCAHLGVPGQIKLEFLSDRLMKVEFEPRSREQYLAALEGELATSVDVEEEIWIDDVSVRISEEDRLVVSWTNVALFRYMISES